MVLTSMNLMDIIFEQSVITKQIPEYETQFGRSYNSPFVDDNQVFFSEIIIQPRNTRVGEIEYGKIGDDTIEIISIHIDKDHRGKGLAQNSIANLVSTLRVKKVITLAAPSSVKFWKKFGFTSLKTSKGYFTKTFA